MTLSRSSRRRIIGAAFAVPLLAVAIIPASRQAAWRTIVPRADATESAIALEAVLGDRKLHVTLANGEVKTYNVAIGTRAYPTPTGQFTISRIIWNPGWVPPNSKWARGKKATGPKDPGNPMKVAKIFFKQPDYYIHGTGHVESLGTAASHGCLRMHPDEVAELGAMLMQAGGVSHDWDWVKRTLRVGDSRTINLKQPVRMTVRASRPPPAPVAEPDTAVAAPSDTVLIPVS
ncbi:MAG: L,D-transpeptidase [Gemmatimonadaceae bacterium]|nr:L,D-transpeptidase [Gemmatimonadaceae bacterium]